MATTVCSLVAVAALVAVCAADPGKWAVYSGINAVDNTGPNATVKFLFNVASWQDCRDLCTSAPKCTIFTYHDDTVEPAYRKMCAQRTDNIFQWNKESGHTSGIIGTWDVETGTNDVSGDSASTPGIKVVHGVKSAPDCQTLCEGEELCTMYTWHDDKQGSFALDCFLVSNGDWRPTPESGHTTGRLGPKPPTPAPPPPPPVAPAEFDCGMRHTAMEFVRQIQPFRAKPELEVMAAALNLPGGDPGGATQCFNVTVPADAPATYDPVFPITGKAVYVDAAKGSDSNAGTLAAPFATVLHALGATRTDRSIRTIALRAGVYYLETALVLSTVDSGLTLQAYNGEKVWLSGGQVLQTKWESAGTPDVWKTDLSGQNVSDITGLRFDRERAVRARYPNGCQGAMSDRYACQGSTKQGRVVSPLDGFGSSLNAKKVLQPTQPTDNQPNWKEINPQTPFRSSGESFQTFQLGIGGSCKDFDPPAGYWCGNQCAGGAPKPPGCIFRSPIGFEIDQTLLPNGPYKDPSRAVVQAWHPGHWASWMFEVATSNSTHLMFKKGGFQGARGNNGAGTFFVENEELDMDNEFFFDPKTSVLYYHNTTQPADAAVVEATKYQILVEVRGTMEAPVKDVSFLGIGFRDTALSFLDNHSMPSGGDWALGRLATVFLYGVDGITIDSCTFQQLDGNAVTINGYARRVVVQKNLFFEIGDNIIAQLGETTGAGDVAYGMGWNGTAGTQPRGTIVRSNFAYACGLFEKQSSFYFQAKSCQNTLDSNVFFHGPRAGINFNDGMGGGTVLKRTLLFSTVMESGDHGPFNSWDRQVYAHEIGTDGKPNVTKEYDEITANFFIGNYFGQEAVDNDDGSQRYETHNNFFAYGRTGMKNDFNGHDNHHHDNVYGYISKGMGICGALPGHADRYYNNKVIQIDGNAYATYDCGCNATGSCPYMAKNSIFTPDGTMGNVCGTPLPDRQKKGMDVGTTVSKWPSPSQVLNWGRAQIGLPPLTRPVRPQEA